MADPLTLAAGLGAAGLGYSMYRYGMAPTLRGVAKGTAYGVGAYVGGGALLGQGSKWYYRDRLERQERRNLFNDLRHDLSHLRNVPTDPGPPSLVPSVHGMTPDDAFIFASERQSRGSAHIHENLNYISNMDLLDAATRNIDLANASERVFGQDLDDDEFPDAPVQPVPSSIEYYDGPDWG